MVRAHSCLDCGISFLTVQKLVGPEDAESIIEELTPPEKPEPERKYAVSRIRVEGLSPVGYFREDARRNGLSVRDYEREAGIALMPAQKRVAGAEITGPLIEYLDSGEEIA